LNGECANRRLSQRRGSPHVTVPNFVPSGCFYPFAPVETVERRTRIGPLMTSRVSFEDMR